MFAKERVKKGEMKEEDIPVRYNSLLSGVDHNVLHISHSFFFLFQYMQRLGSWDNSDVKGAKKKEWTETDKKNISLPSWLSRGQNMWRGLSA